MKQTENQLTEEEKRMNEGTVSIRRMTAEDADHYGEVVLLDGRTVEITEDQFDAIMIELFQNPNVMQEGMEAKILANSIMEKHI